MSLVDVILGASRAPGWLGPVLIVTALVALGWLWRGRRRR